MREKLKYLVRWKKYITEEDTWERLENLKNTMNLVVRIEDSKLYLFSISFLFSFFFFFSSILRTRD